MKRSEWSDNELEELLQQLPKIQDHRDPRDIYQNLSLKRRKMKPWIVPSIAAAAALLLFFILIPQFMDGTKVSYENAQEEKASTKNNDIKLNEKHEDSTIAMEKDSNSPKEQIFSGAVKKEQVGTSGLKTAIYEDEIGNGRVLTYWIPDQQAQILIPVSIIVSDSKEKSWLTLYNEKMASLKEAEWGLSDFYPLNVKLKLDEKNNNILVDAPTDHQYGQGSAIETNFLDVLNKDISSNSNSKKLIFTTNGEPGIQLGNFGDIQELNVEDVKRHAFFFYYPEGSESKLPLLTPSIDTYTDVQAAIEAMKTDPAVSELKSSLLPLLPINDISILDKTLLISFKGNTSLLNDQLTTSSFEALLLTAKEFGLEKIIVKDSPLKNIGTFDLSKETKVPVAPNIRNIQ
ncbi:hypothetical protein [Neobacillus jeddahensis]|uniref:hypothetical protein n=1 Tax=Neobacillus jeddahensis TaxID=1461580 RepID=UPI00058DE0C3|nr:hypothetical protein [Neobacillus jeddahensis]